MLPEQYSLSGIYPDQDGVRLEAADQESADVLLRHLRASGWTVTASPIWPRYSFASPPSLSNRFTPEQIVAGLIMRNPELPPGALCFAGSHEAEGGEGSAEETTRRLVWVDFEPDAIEYLCSVDFLLRTVFGAVRLREAPRNKRHPKRSLDLSKGTGGTPPPSLLRNSPKAPIPTSLPTPYHEKFLPTRQGRWDQW